MTDDPNDYNDMQEPDWDSIQEAEAILAGEIEADAETITQVRRWLAR